MHAIETEPREVVIDGHRFEVWVRVIVEIAESEVRRHVEREADERAAATRWRPYDEARGADNIRYSLLNASSIGVRYLGPVEDDKSSSA